MHGDWWGWLLIGYGLGYYLKVPMDRACDWLGHRLLRWVSRGKSGKGDG